MICPKCRLPSLELRTVFDSWSAVEPPTCSLCHGMWLSEAVLSELIDERPPLLSSSKMSDSTDEVAGTCPEGHGDLIRAAVDTQPPFHLDRCPICRVVWFDGGEWQRLASSHLLKRLDEIWIAEWENQLGSMAKEKEMKEWGTETLGPRLSALLDAAADEIERQGVRAKALAYLRALTTPSKPQKDS